MNMRRSRNVDDLTRLVKELYDGLREHDEEAALLIMTRYLISEFQNMIAHPVKCSDPDCEHVQNFRAVFQDYLPFNPASFPVGPFIDAEYYLEKVSSCWEFYSVGTSAIINALKHKESTHET